MKKNLCVSVPIAIIMGCLIFPFAGELWWVGAIAGLGWGAIIGVAKTVWLD